MPEKTHQIIKLLAENLPELEKIFPGEFEKGIQLINGSLLLKSHFLPFSPELPVLIELPPDGLFLERLKTLLQPNYLTETRAYVLLGRDEQQYVWRLTTISEINRIEQPVRAIFIPAGKPGSSLEGFMEIIARLRAPDGCPWDRKQTHASLRPYLLEETYEALDALDRGDLLDLKEELGDILLQIALHAQIASENGVFSITEVLSGISNKIVSRHPHVFGDVSVRDDRDVVKNWEKLKEIERAENGRDPSKGLLDGIPAILPALSQAQVIQDRAARVGFDWPEIAPVIDKVMEELQEVKEAATEKERAGELGDLLFAVVNLVRWYRVDAESALRQTNQKFRRRFAYLEEHSKSAGKELPKMTLEEMDALWEEAKGLEE